LAIYDDRSTMISPVQTSQFAELHRTESLDSAARPLQIRKFPEGHLFGTKVIEQNTNGDISSSRADERIEYLFTDDAVGPNVYAEVDRFFCAVYGFDEGRQEFIAIVQNGDRPTMLKRSIYQV